MDWRLQLLAYLLLGMSPKVGRLVVREPRATDYVQMLRDLMALTNIKPSLDLNQLYNAVDNLQGLRNKLAHGIWLDGQSADLPILRVTSGSWTPEPQKSSVKRKIYPQSWIIGVKPLRAAVRELDTTVQRIIDLHNEIAELLPEPPEEPT